MGFSSGQKKWICLLLAGILILSGMCLESNRAYSFLSCDNSHDVSVYSSISSYTITNHDICTSELIGLRSANRIVQNRSRSEKTDSVIITMIVFFLAALLENLHILLQSVDGYGQTTTNSLSAIIFYIHHQDSSKG